MEIINLDMTPSTVTPNAHAGQYDSARTVRFMLKNGGVPFTLAGTETITAEITRSDNTEATVNVANTSSNYVDVVFDDTVCTVKGLYACELRIKDGDVDIGSKNFALLVQRDPYDNKNVRIVTVGPADICTFETTLAEPYQSVLVNINATGGNGTPDSPIPINGYTEANITANDDVITIAFGQTVYGGVLDVTRGKLTVTYGIVDLGDLPWIKDITTVVGKVMFRAQLTNAKNGFNCLCSNYPYVGSYSNLVDKSCAYIYNTRIAIQDNTYDNYTADDFKTAMNGVMLVNELATPFDIDLTPEVISAVVGTNNVFADCGETTVKYLKAE